MNTDRTFLYEKSLQKCKLGLILMHVADIDQLEEISNFTDGNHFSSVRFMISHKYVMNSVVYEQSYNPVGFSLNVVEGDELTPVLIDSVEDHSKALSALMDELLLCIERNNSFADIDVDGILRDNLSN